MSLRGEVAEWSIAAVLKTAEPQGSGGSNPSLSAMLRFVKRLRSMPCDLYATASGDGGSFGEAGHWFESRLGGVFKPGNSGGFNH